MAKRTSKSEDDGFDPRILGGLYKDFKESPAEEEYRHKKDRRSDRRTKRNKRYTQYCCFGGAIIAFVWALCL